jgi:hypothetical protein
MACFKVLPSHTLGETDKSLIRTSEFPARLRLNVFQDLRIGTLISFENKILYSGGSVRASRCQEDSRHVRPLELIYWETMELQIN